MSGFVLHFSGSLLSLCFCLLFHVSEMRKNVNIPKVKNKFIFSFSHILIIAVISLKIFLPFPLALNV